MEHKIKSLIKKLSRFGFSIRPREKNHTDPVCGMEASGNLFKTDYQGTSYFFCSGHCKDQFDTSPGMYLK